MQSKMCICEVKYSVVNQNVAKM